MPTPTRKWKWLQRLREGATKPVPSLGLLFKYTGTRPTRRVPWPVSSSTHLQTF